MTLKFRTFTIKNKLTVENTKINQNIVSLSYACPTIIEQKTSFFWFKKKQTNLNHLPIY